jgi:phage baseplate assembly protein W
MATVASYGMTFPQRLNGKGFFEFTGDIQLLVRCSIYQILGTRIGERVMEPEFGSRIHELIFEPIDQICISLGRVYTIQAIERWEPRVSLNDVDVRVNTDQGKMEIFGIYEINKRSIKDSFRVGLPRIEKGKIQ